MMSIHALRSFIGALRVILALAALGCSQTPQELPCILPTGRPCGVPAGGSRHTAALDARARSAARAASGTGPGSRRGPPSAGEWVVVWSDEFDSVLDSSKWRRELTCWGGGNNEQQCYTDRSANSFVSDGVLHLVAREESFSGPALADRAPGYEMTDASVTLPFTSARLNTKGLLDIQYGRVEIRAKLAGGRGMWPAFWMLPSDEVYGGWPNSGEIDIMEAVNLGEPGAANEVLGTLHYGLPWPDWKPHGDNAVVRGELIRDFHVFAIEWEADEVRWFVDGAHYQTQTSSGWYNYIWQGQERGFGAPTSRAPFDQRFHLLLNLAVGGGMPGPPSHGWQGDRELLVDYVRVSRCSADNDAADGSGCAGAADRVDPGVAINVDDGDPTITEFVLFENGTRELEGGEGTIVARLQPNVWEEAAGSVVTSTLDVGGAHELVWDARFTGPGNIFLTPVSSSDVGGTAAPATSVALVGDTAWTNVGELEFDLFVESIDPGTQLVVKLDSGYPNLGQVTLSTPPVGEWQHVSVRVAELLANPHPAGEGLNVSNVENLFVLEPIGTSLAHVRIDNVKLQCATSPSPLDWQAHRLCSIRLAR